jgi:hypothetical protein
MLNRLLFLFFAFIIGTCAHAQGLAQEPARTPNPAGVPTVVPPQYPTGAPAPVPPPSPEEFVNAICHTVVDSTLSNYYLLRGADTCRFVRYDYDEWSKYHLLESVPISILNELAEKVYLSRYPYSWKQHALPTATLITSRQADSLLYLNPPNGDGTSRHLVFSFSLPQFTDDGQYAVIDLNMVCGGHCGLGSTYIFHLTSKGWKLIGAYRNWSA